MTALKNAFSNRPFIGAVIFVASSYILEELLLDFPQTRSFQFAIEFYSHLELLMTLLSSVAAYMICYLFALAALKSSYLFQTLYVLLLGLSSLVQYGYWKAVQRFIVPVDLKIAGATPIDTWTGARVLFFNWYCIVPVLIFILLLFMFSERKGLKASVTQPGALLVLIVLLAFSNRVITSRSINMGLSLSSFYQTASRFIIDSLLPPRREIVDYRYSKTPQNNIVLVIDESIRGDHLGINGYNRDTAPILNKLATSQEGFHNFGLAVSGATCSCPSNALILTGVRPGLDRFELVMSYPTIFQYAKAMGYETYFLDVQSNSLWNGLTDHDLTFIDWWFKAHDFGEDLDADFRAADMVAKILFEGNGRFIVLNKRGVHFLYNNSYPAKAAVWLPLPAGDYIADPNLISNPYDNGILYNVNTFFERLLVNPKILENTILLYTSDHGQTLFANGETWLHCKDSPAETIVPLILISKKLPPVKYSYKASHSNILPTLLDMMGVPASQRAHRYAPSLFSEPSNLETNNFFFDGSLRLIDFPD